MLKKMTAACICFMVCAGTVSAQERYTVDKVVAVVGNSAIKYSELVEARNVLVEERRKQGYTSDRDPMNEALEGLLVQKLLYNQALIDSVQINLDAVSSEVEARLAMMTEEAGSTAALEAEMGMPYYEIRQDFKGKYEEMYYAQAMRSDVISKVKITPGEVEMFYRELDRDSLPIVPEQYVYAQIVRYPTSSKEAKQRVREELLDMRERVINGTRFDLLARMYSVDPGTAMQGGEMEMSLNQFVQPFADALESCSPVRYRRWWRPSTDSISSSSSRRTATGTGAGIFCCGRSIRPTNWRRGGASSTAWPMKYAAEPLHSKMPR